MVRRIEKHDLDRLIRLAAEGRELFAPSIVGGRLHLARADDWDSERHCPGPARPVEPLKSLLFPPRERVDAVPGDPGERERVVVGVKACDLSALAIHDHVFRDSDPPDPFYLSRRARTRIIACDCTDPLPVCFCNAVGEQPFALRGYDLNVSPAGPCWLVEAGSEWGRALLETLGAGTQPSAAEMAQRDARRAQVGERVAASALGAGLPPGADFRNAIAAAAEYPLWDEFAADCVECGACNYVCCTCHCFLLVDGFGRDDVPARLKQWDSCLLKDFARVAGGANPRGHRAERLRNRFDKKFVFFPDTLGRYGCDGCGRCVEACAGKIDIRNVLKRTVAADGV